MEGTHVVTCFLRHGTDVLLCRRSDAVGSYVGQWGAVAGHAEGNPDTQAWREIAEETGLEDDCERLRAGEPFPVVDEDRKTRWVVHPYLFDCASEDVTTNEETSAWEWVPPTEILRRDTVPELWASYDAVRPTVETVEADGEHGAAYLSVRALECLRDSAALAMERGVETDLAALAERLRGARPGMAVVANRVARTLRSGADPEMVERAASAEIQAALDADEAAATNAAERIDGERVVTCSRSGTVLRALETADPESVLLTESRPGSEGVAAAESLADTHDVTLVSDAAASGALESWGADRVLVGADTVFESAISNKVGTYPLALAAREMGIPFDAVCADDKIAPADWTFQAEAAPEIYGGDADLSVANPLFERVPLALVDSVVTEDGELDGEAVAKRARARRVEDAGRDG